jgi:hypothetical protein
LSSTVRSRPGWAAVIATERASCSSVLRPDFPDSLRVRYDNDAGTSTTCSPASTSCCESSRPSPLAFSTAQIRSGQSPAQLTSQAGLDSGDAAVAPGHFAAYNGTAPIEASSGDIKRHRLNQGGNRQLNSVIHIAAVTQVRHHGPGRAYLQRKLAERKTNGEAMRALKRQLSRRHLPPAARRPAAT